MRARYGAGRRSRESFEGAPRAVGMMDLGRIRGREARRREGGRAAAVLIPVLERSADRHLVLIKRADDLTEHAGQMSFPGGSREPYDPDLFATAKREANEEIGLDVENVDRVGELDEIRTTTEYVVRPFVARVPEQEFTPDGIEVAEIAVLPVAAFLVPDNYERYRRRGPGGAERQVHSFSIQGYEVWGATGQLVVQLLELTTEWRADHAATTE